MSKVDDLIIQAVDSRFKVLANQLKFDRTYYGKVVNIDGRHAIVNINGIECRAQIKDGMFIVTNDVVVLKAPNGNFSFLYVDGKLGEAANADVKNQIGDLSTLTTTVKDNLVNSINEVDNEINVLEGKALQYKGVFGGDLNTLNTTESLGIYRLQATCTNTPDDSIKYVFEHAVLIVSTDGYSITQDLTLTHNAYSAYVNRRYFRTSITVTFQKWEQIATTSKTDISFPFTGSYMSRGGYVSKVTKDAMGLVTINVTFQINDGSTLLPQGNNIIGTLPVGYRPQGIVAGVGSTAFGGNMVNVRVTVGSDGVVTCTTGNGYTGSNVIGFSISYYV